jgi:hypothetical protein
MGTIVQHRGPSHAIARPLKVLIPLIQQDLQDGAAAGSSYYLAAGAKLIEAKTQVSHGSWGAWLNKNFRLHQTTARRYMRAADVARENPAARFLSVAEITGQTEQKARYKKAWAPFKAAQADLDVETVAQARQTQAEEIRLHRDLALELIDMGYKALATRLHPDRGGSREAMARLNRVRVELKEVAHMRRFV